MQASHREILRFLREAYLENGGRGGLWDFFGNSISHRVFLKGEDILNSRLEMADGHYLRGTEIEKTAIQARLYLKERDLLYASVFLIGWVERIESKPEPICAPLFLYPAELDDEGLEHGATLRIRIENRQINYEILEAVGGADFARDLEGRIEHGLIGDGCVGEIRRLFNEAFPDCDSSALLTYPQLRNERELRAAFESVRSSPSAPFVLLPVCALALVNKSNSMRGVINELDAMVLPETPLSAPVRALLGEDLAQDPPALIGRVPATLSPAQNQVIAAARVSPVSLAIGPPGTGKSFTIAALAIETLSRGGSVLITSKMDHAVDVVGDKIESTIGLEGVVTRGGRSEHLRELKKFIDELLAGIHTGRAWGSKKTTAAEIRLRSLEKRIDHLRTRLEKRLKYEHRWGELLADENPGTFKRIRKFLHRKLSSRREPLWKTAAELESLIDERHRQTIEFLKASRVDQLVACLERDRTVIQNFSRAIRARTGMRQASYFEKLELRSLLGALPVWLVKLSDVHQILPLDVESFDLAIIDEATQCDIASAMPVLQRARRAVIVGDPKQLRHLSFLPIARQQALAAQFGLSRTQLERFNFRDVSLLDLASEVITRQSSVAFLDKHFRSHPEIIAFSNREFYSGQLRIMTSHRAQPAMLERPMQVHFVENAFREPNGTNPTEAAGLIAALVSICERQAELNTDAVHSIGVLSPFRNQVEYLRNELSQHPLGGSLLRRHQLLIGTAHSFQGEERDLMFLSLCLDDNSPSASFRFLEKPDIFNVAITRARLQNSVWHSFIPSARPQSSLLARYLAHARGERTANGFPNDVRDAFADEVACFLRASGASVQIGHAMAGIEVDLIYTLDGVTRGIDLIGYPGAMADAFPLDRIIMFRRVGLPILPLPYSEWLTDRKTCEKWLLPNGIFEQRETGV